MKLMRSLFLVTVALSFSLSAQESGRWELDKSHSYTNFKIRHLLANVTGSFREFDAAINLDQENPSASTVEFTVQAASIDTANQKRDDHLRSADFFEVETFPTISFKSTAVKAKSKTEFDVAGDFTMHGVTKRITLPVTLLGFGKDARGNDRVAFEVETSLDRKDYGIVWNRAADQGSVLLGDDVKVSISLQFSKKKPE
ncbi:MAG TPA: YceI family protein [Thermoanaerobaculia bacterium]